MATKVSTARCGHCGEVLPIPEVKAHFAAKYAATGPAPEDIIDAAPAAPVAVPLIDSGFTPKATAPEPAGLDWAAIKALPAARYATTEGEKVEFWRVEVSEQGMRFITKLIGAPGDFRKVRVTKATQVAVLNEIAQDPAAAMKAFADHFTACGRCCSPLTDEVSRERGLGPDCFGYWTADGIGWI